MNVRLKSKKRAILGGAVSIIILFCLISFVGDRIMFSQAFARVDNSRTLGLYDSDIATDYPFVDVEFVSGSNTLRGHIYGSGNPGRGLMVFVHGMFSQHEDYLALICAFVDKGWRVFAYDATGCGISDGDSMRGMPQSALDLDAALTYVETTGMANGAPVVVVGHSWGAYATGSVLNFDHDIKAAVCLSGFSDPVAIMNETADGLLGPLGKTQYPSIYLNLLSEFGSAATLSAVDGINHANIPVMVLHGDGDATIQYDGASIMGHANQITNSQVVYVTKSEENRNGHNTYFYSPESQAYLNDVMEGLSEIAKGYGGLNAIPQNVFEAYRATVDLRKANTADPVLIDQIDSFLVASIS